MDLLNHVDWVDLARDAFSRGDAEAEFFGPCSPVADNPKNFSAPLRGISLHAVSGRRLRA